jgi:hypothetical protein
MMAPDVLFVDLAAVVLIGAILWYFRVFEKR